MNREVLYLVAIFVVGCIAITFRAIMFNLAGERFVARLRKQVISSMSDCILFKHKYYYFISAVLFHFKARIGVL